jgi:hypothetical protein
MATTTYPRAQAKKPAAAIADHGRQVTRAHARLDQVESTQSLQNTQISTAQTDITSNTTAINAVNTGSGGTSQENFLGNLSKMAHYTETASGGWTSGGAILGSSQIDAAVLVGWMNDVSADIAAILSRLEGGNFMA